MKNRPDDWTLGRTLVSLCSVLCIAAPAGATDVQGAVSGNWTAGAGPYVVVADAYVPAGDTLRVGPGVEVRFASNTVLRVYGCLVATGLPDTTVLFGGQQAVAGHWRGIHVDAGADGVRLENAIIQDALVGITFSGSGGSVCATIFRNNVNGIDCSSGAAVEIHDSEFASNTNSALRANSSSVLVRRCRFHGNSSGGIESVAYFSGCTASRILGCEFFDNTNAAIEIVGGTDLTIANNTIAYNGYGMIVASSNCLVSSNAVCWNQIGVAVDNAAPTIRYNDVWGNTDADFLGAPAPVGQYDLVNPNGTPCDSLGNISQNPGFADASARDFRPLASSPLVDAGDPDNPAGFPYSGVRPDIGAYEYNDGTVPVELAEFRWLNGRILWRTESESNSWGFSLERSTDGRRWDQVAFVPAHGTTVQPHTYFAEDPFPPAGTVYYRLVQIDLDGSRAVYGPIEVRARGNEGATVRVYPNPTNAGAFVHLNVGHEQAAGAVQVRLFDATGRLVRSYSISPAETEAKLHLDGRDANGIPLPSGTYVVAVRVGRKVMTRKITFLR